ncbi:periplasmic chaperone for outer membrane proteins Skp [Halanaerobium sp. DL-01]|uniref:OmpH family outer membrane protein n=1 Tax=Halanaerobium sp. DL-01 TaxID=1653064 RepID=UPI000DF43472|nr:OmpH family outer membrane protein [Halanaerobium sp. DL-01]RCW85673.1 periplasmic chaperone for outer membrane proteins Skp [Halanaerobium sp. DL-01]
MKWGKNVWIIVFAVILLIAAGLSALVPVKNIFSDSKYKGEIACVDLEAVFDAHPFRKEAESFLNQKASQLQQEMEQKSADVERSNLQSMLREYQQQLTDVESKLLSDLLKEIDSSIKAVAEQNEVKFVLEKRNVLYGGYDLTDEVIKYIVDNDENRAESSEEN